MANTSPQTDPSSSTLGSLVRNRRGELELRQEELADLAGVSIRFVHSLEHGKASVRLDKVLDVLEVLGLEIDVRVRR